MHFEVTRKDSQVIKTIKSLVLAMRCERAWAHRRGTPGYKTSPASAVECSVQYCLIISDDLCGHSPSLSTRCKPGIYFSWICQFVIFHWGGARWWSWVSEFLWDISPAPTLTWSQAAKYWVVVFVVFILTLKYQEILRALHLQTSLLSQMSWYYF